MQSMNLKVILSALLVIVSFEGLTQNIYSALQHDRGVDLRTEPKVEELIVKTTFINKESTYTKKDVILVNSKHKIISETRFDKNGELESRLTKTFDSSDLRSLTRKLERWHPVLGYSFKTAYYTYDENGHLTKVQDKDQDDILYQETTITNNENGDPIELVVRTSNSDQYGKEVAIYDYPNNRVITKVLGNNGAVISESSITIDFSVQMNDNTYNEFGDLIKSSKHEYEYKYDKHNNWTKKVIFKMVDGKRTRYQSITRKIKYLK